MRTPLSKSLFSACMFRASKQSARTTRYLPNKRTTVYRIPETSFLTWRTESNKAVQFQINRPSKTARSFFDISPSITYPCLFHRIVFSCRRSSPCSPGIVCCRLARRRTSIPAHLKAEFRLTGLSLLLLKRRAPALSFVP